MVGWGGRKLLSRGLWFLASWDKRRGSAPLFFGAMENVSSVHGICVSMCGQLEGPGS